MMQVAIIGAGIGGLTLYHALRQHGISAAVYEAAPVLRAVGAGIAVPSNGMQILGRLGLAANVLQRGCALERIEMCDALAGVLQTLELKTYTREFHYGIVAIHRAALHDVLVAGVPEGDLHLGKQCVRVRTGYPAAVVSFADGSSIQAPMVIGADGISSAIRRSIFPTKGLRPWDSIAYRGVVPFDLPPHQRRTGQVVWHDGCESGFVDVGEGQVFWWYDGPAIPAADGNSPAARMAFLRRRVSKFPETIQSLLAATDPDAVLRTELHDLAPLNVWYRENVALMGDAAHASMPYLGQGAAQAIEDAYVLAAMLAQQTTPDVFAVFQQSRKKKADMVVRLSRMLGHFAHMRHPITRTARNFLFRSMPEFVNRRQMNQLFRLN